ncbi:predicted protein [Thalassiosira pseudonana CCMP1335]|uniref:Uncharacterized protein n=1 Tax=Thalassiosira pseudonana TaxID=35128 RepID=B8LCQ2_THAPS|nr:predicted protein [Thalassiosira pseudonana CCMP1335]EED87022.1 predicted protein [Thalassiosira pseudonana CCMP1335]
MKSTCIATLAIIGSATAAPRRMRTSYSRVSQRVLQDGSMSMSMPTPATNDEVVVLISAESMSMSLPAPEEPVFVVSEPLSVLYESMSLPAIWEELLGSLSMSMPNDWTPEDLGFVPAEGGGWIPEAPETDDSTEEPPATDDSTKDVVEDESSAAGALVSGVVSAACLVGAVALF